MNKYKDCYKLKGFIDIHIHGAVGQDVVTSGPNGLQKMAESLARHGVVGFLPTIPASSVEETIFSLESMKKVMEEKSFNGAKIIGAHLEGPFMKEAYKGALDYTKFASASVEYWEKLVGEYENIVRRVTVDPLQDGVLDFIPYLVSKSISVTIGHTAADAETVNKAIELGADSITHIFNAMPPMHHRNPGPVGAALSNRKCKCELILDFLHVSPIAAKVVIEAKGPENVAIVTDSCEAAGMPDGDYELGGRLVHVRNGEARLPEGNLASSTVFMDQELRNVIELGYSIENAETMLAKTPASLVSYEHDEDYVIVDKDLNVVEVIISGKTVYRV